MAMLSDIELFDLFRKFYQEMKVDSTDSSRIALEWTDEDDNQKYFLAIVRLAPND